jgi:hypothetical protein
MGRLTDIHNCEKSLERFSLGPHGEIVSHRYAGANPYPNAMPYRPEDVTLREASPTAKSGGSKRMTLTPPVDYLVILTANRQAPRGVYAPSLRRFAGRTAVTGYVDPYVARDNKPNGQVSKNVRFIP